MYNQIHVIEKICTHVDIFFSDSAHRDYLTAKYSYDYDYAGLDYDDFPVANPETNTMTPLSRKDDTVPTNYPVATKEHNKAVSKSYLE